MGLSALQEKQPTTLLLFHDNSVGVPQVRASALTWVYDSRAKPILVLFRPFN
jgi:hypothetical protein